VAGAGDSCQAEVASLEDLRRLDATLEAHGRVVAGAPSAVFRSPELRRLDLARPLPGAAGLDLLPAEVRRLLGWPAKGPLAPGAFPVRR
jgi:hypothetical protein